MASLQPGARVFFEAVAQLVPSAGFTSGPLKRLRVDQAIANGTGTNQAQNLHYSMRNLTASASETIDLQTIPNANGNALAAVDVVVFIVKAADTNGANIRLDDSPANPWTALFSSSGATDNAQLDIAPGACVPVLAFVDGSYPVSGSSKAFQVTNTDGAAAADYELFILTRDA